MLTVKLKLVSIIRDKDEAMKISMLDYINNLVLCMSQATFDAYNYANYFLHRSIEQGENVPPLDSVRFN